MEHEKAIQNLAVECYLLGEMAPEEREAFEEHYFECSVCAEDVRNASQFLEDAKDILAREHGRIPQKSTPQPATPASRPARNWFGWNWLQPQWAGAAIAILLVVRRIQNFGTIPGLRRQLDQTDVPRALNTALLRPQTRGDAAILKTQAGAPVLLTFDVPESDASKLQFVVESEDGKAVLQAAGDAPLPGEQVNFFIPKLDLQAGTYKLVEKPKARPARTG